MANRLEIRLGGKTGGQSVSPEVVDFRRLLSPLVKELGDAAVIEAGIDTLTHQTDTTTQETTLPLLALTGVSSSKRVEAKQLIGASYHFTVGPEAVEAIGRITEGLAGLPGGRLVPDAARHVQIGLNRVIRKGLAVQLVNGVTTPIFTANNPPPKIAVHPTRAFRTEIAVRVLRVGGRRPAARVQLLGSNEKVTVILSGEKAARELGHHLYRDAVLEGEGEWVVDPAKFFTPTRLLFFKVTAFRLLQSTSVEEVIEQLTQVAGGIWDQIDPSKLDEVEEASEGCP